MLECSRRVRCGISQMHRFSRLAVLATGGTVVTDSRLQMRNVRQQRLSKHKQKTNKQSNKQTNKHTRTRTHAHAHAHARARTRTRTRTRTHTHTHAQHSLLVSPSLLLVLSLNVGRVLFLALTQLSEQTPSTTDRGLHMLKL